MPQFTPRIVIVGSKIANRRFVQFVPPGANMHGLQASHQEVDAMQDELNMSKEAFRDRFGMIPGRMT